MSVLAKQFSINREASRNQIPINSYQYHLGQWNGTPPLAPARAPPDANAGPWTREPCDDVDPTPDYENVLTD